MTTTAPCAPVDLRREEIRPDDARLVLQHYGHDVPGPDRSDTYSARLVTLIVEADYVQERAFAAAFPALTAAVRLARYSPTGIATLRAIANPRVVAPRPPMTLLTPPAVGAPTAAISQDRSTQMYPDYDSPRLTGPYLDVHAERARQLRELGQEDHTLPEWVTALLENLGGVAKAVLEATRDTEHPSHHTSTVRAETLALTTAGMALLEALDRVEAADQAAALT
ncbi:hypothetical protein ACFRDV_22340 [Streptomyces fagopyri]|uniref:hypothetical protein n=1 Tax=Streptomyces fagopyri TaxID=2662397 RepID=UPI003693E5BE